jgi:transglutaminase-like putative cysteine protease
VSRAELGHALALGGTSAVTTCAALSSWHGFVTYPGHYLAIAAGIGVVLAAVGAVLPARLPLWAVLAIELLLCLLIIEWVASGSLVPGMGQSALQRFHAGLSTANIYALPLGRSLPSLTPVLVLGSAAFLLLVQWLAIHLRRPTVAGLAVLAIFALPAGYDGVGPSVPSFVAAAAGFLALLVLDGRHREHHWGRPASETAGAGLRSVRTAMPAGLVAIAVAVLVAAILPLPKNPLNGLGGDSGGVTIHRPEVDMRQELERGADVPLIDINTDEPAPSYLRIAVLNRFTGVEWSTGDRSVSSQRRAEGPVPLPPGLSPTIPRQAYHVAVHALAAFNSTWLPTDFPIDQIDASGDWRYDPETMDFIAAGTTNASDATYSMQALRVDYGTTGAYFHDAPADSVPAEDEFVPDGVPTSVRDLAVQVTSGAKDDYQKALLLQLFFRSTGHFRYSLRGAPTGADGQVLQTFLSTGPGGRVGYCQQFASAMAIMARIVGIPARVAVGFLQPQRIGRNTWEYSSHDLHAWPELYFSGAGWVRFEPTPASRASSAPPYTLVPLPAGIGPGDPQSEPTRTPTASTTGPSASPRPGGPRTNLPQGTDASALTHHGSGLAWLWWTLGVVLILAGAATIPAVVRRRQRATRLAGDAESIWAEVRATAIDLDLDWRDGRSPREQADGLATAMAFADAEASAALERLVDALQQVRYASSGRAIAVAARTDLGRSGQLVVKALEAGAAQRRRRIARWVPPSLIPR